MGTYFSCKQVGSVSGDRRHFSKQSPNRIHLYILPILYSKLEENHRLYIYIGIIYKIFIRQTCAIFVFFFNQGDEI